MLNRLQSLDPEAMKKSADKANAVEMGKLDEDAEVQLSSDSLDNLEEKDIECPEKPAEDALQQEKDELQQKKIEELTEALGALVERVLAEERKTMVKVAVEHSKRKIAEESKKRDKIYTVYAVFSEVWRGIKFRAYFLAVLLLGAFNFPFFLAASTVLLLANLLTFFSFGRLYILFMMVFLLNEVAWRLILSGMIGLLDPITGFASLGAHVGVNALSSDHMGPFGWLLRISHRRSKIDLDRLLTKMYSVIIGDILIDRVFKNVVCEDLVKPVVHGFPSHVIDELHIGLQLACGENEAAADAALNLAEAEIRKRMDPDIMMDQVKMEIIRKVGEQLSTVENVAKTAYTIQAVAEALGEADEVNKQIEIAKRQLAESMEMALDTEQLARRAKELAASDEFRESRVVYKTEE